ncbi:hypothetical protein RF55_11249 [Lasius niger]|uniref:Uncharacterized protein n=1 Tax=Lasius niger TaxID=67767 RepID=A0A0J7KFU1_LASNI|nr:hypothetical protein RF55_11249 [Lasius niger]
MPKLSRDKLDEIQEDIIKHLKTIHKLRENLDSNERVRKREKTRDTGPSQREAWSLPNPRKGIKLVENIQLVPPRAGPIVTPNDKWTDIGKGGKVKKTQQQQQQRKQSTEEKKTTEAVSLNKFENKSKERGQKGGKKDS